MAEYIDKAKVLEKAVEIKGYSSKMISAWDVAHIPSADVVEVVRCKDCKWYEKGKSYTPYCNNVKNLFEEMEPFDYCSYGERRGEE